MLELVDLFRLGQIPQPVQPKIVQAYLFWQAGVEQLLGGPREQHLSTMSSGA